jgi:hypothetical protein
VYIVERRKNNFATAKNAVHNAIVSSATAAKNRELLMMVPQFYIQLVYEATLLH